MRSIGLILTSTTLLALGGALSSCASDGSLFGGDDMTMSDDAEFGAVESRAYSTIQRPDGTTVGRAVLSWDGEQIQTVAQLNDMPPGTYAVHIHETGRCDPPGYQSAGGHWNPTNEGHGFEDPEDGWHKGDLRNVTVAADGTGSSTTMTSGAAWTGSPGALFDADGSAVVVHQNADDYRTDPAGDAGSRVACGVVQQG